MIRGLHGMFYSNESAAAREFLRDALRLPFTDVGGGWLIFDLPAADVGIHPSDSSDGGSPGTHKLSLWCDDIQGTMTELRGRGVTFAHEPQDHGYGYVTYFQIPGGIEVQLYEPKYQKPTRKPAPAKRAAKKKAAKPAGGAKRKPVGKKKAAKRAAPRPKRSAGKRKSGRKRAR